ncbi:dynein beta chain, ciliary-like, partial [Plakobranchus ocellatus]
MYEKKSNESVLREIHLEGSRIKAIRRRYYHQIDKFHQLLRLLSNEVVHRAIAMVGDDILREPLESYSKLKEALRVCAAFRGTYLDFKDKADDQNAKNIAENAEKLAARPQGNLFTTKMYGPHAYAPRYGLRHLDGGSSSDSMDEDELWMDSPWPARNAPCFDLLNNFMERCNDVLELVETTRHFRLLAGAAEVGGAGSASLDAMVKELHVKYTLAMKDFFSQVSNVLSIDGTQMFERAFFNFRTTVKALEKRLSGILRLAFEQCGIVQSQLRLLEVFEGVSGRELVQAHLKDVDKQLVYNFNAELQQCRGIFKERYFSPPSHHNMPPIVSKLMWVHALKERIRIPMEKMRQVSPHSLEGDQGYQMRETYTEVMGELEAFESNIVAKWQTDIVSELTSKLKQPLLIAEEYDDEIDVRPQVIHVNLDPQLLLVLKEIHYLSRPPFNIKLPEPAKELLRNTNSQDLNVTATRLETIVSKYNTIMRTISAFERPMFERKLLQIDSLLEQGLQQFTWKMKESADFIESAMSLVCLDVHQNLDIVQTNCHEVAEMTMSWSLGMLDVFQARDKSQSYSMDQLMEMHKQLNDELETVVSPAGLRVHALVKESYEVVQISAASPAWRDYIDYMDAIVLDGLKQASLASLRGMLNTLVQANMVEDPAESLVVPILTIRLELIENNVAFRPPLDQSTSVISVQELVHTWLQSYLARGKLVTMLGPKGSYEDYISADEEVKQLLADINQVVSDNGEDCKKLLEVFKEYAFLWQQDVSQTFEDFLQGYITPNPLRSRSATQHTGQKQDAAQSAGPLLAGKSDRSSQASRASSAKSTISAEVLEHAERTFLTPKAVQEGEKSNVPSLDEFDHEIDTYRTARDEIMGLEEYHNVGWIRVDLQPIKQVLTTYASKWMWTFTKYLSDQVTSMLEKLDLFLKRIEPEIESITGEERDTASFMKMMRLFNEVSAQQSEMDGKFAAMHRTVLLLKKYGQILPEKTQFLFNAAPGRWNNLKTKVSLAKQRLGPRIQEESASITVDLEAFSVRVQSLSDDLDNSDVYQRECSIADAHSIVDSFSKRLLVLENEAQDLIELQELLEASVVNFSVLPTCRHELNNLKQVWETVRVIEEQQSDWKRHRWQKMNTKFLREETNKQLDIVRALPEDVFTWDVYMGLHESITTIQACLPLIDDLSNPAMRTRHWKQLVRVTGGALTIDNDTLKRMTLRELLSLGLQQHVDDVRAIVQRAVKDLAIENALKTYEEVWLSKVFELRYHVRNKLSVSADVTQDNQSEYSQSEVGGPVSTAASRNARTVSRVSNQSSHSKNKRSSISSLPASLMNLGEDPGTLMLLTHTDPIFEELEHHQITLQAMQSNSAAGSFLDEVLKWQKRLQNIEAVLTCWLDVQDKWVEMEEVYTSSDVRQALSHDANRFATANKDFRLLMRATEKNPNVLQCCSRKNILKILEHMNQSLEVCRKSLLHHLERRRQIFPRFFFLSMEDVLHIVCTGYDLNMVNLYISKVLQNIGCLSWEEVDDQERYSFIITGVQSALGEMLQLDQAVCCEGQIETWLSSLVSQIKSSLLSQLSQALGYGKTSKPQLMRTNSPKKSSNPAEGENQSLNEGQKSDTASRTQLPQGEGNKEAEGEEEGGEERKITQVISPTKAVAEGEGAGEAVNIHPPYSGRREGNSWTLDHITEIVHLATRVQTSQQLAEALESFDNGEKDALTDCLAKLDNSIKATVLLLKGLEGEKEEIIQSSKDKQEMNSHGISGERDRESEIDLPGSPAFRKQSLDVHGQEVTRSPGFAHGMEDEIDGASKDGTATTLPVDTMNLIVEPTSELQGGSLAGGASGTGPASGVGRDASRFEGLGAGVGEEGEEVQVPPEVKLMLFPSQVHKLTSLLSLLAHLRDLVQRLISISDQRLPTESFDWKSQLRYEFEPVSCLTTVSCLSAQFEYGFEYLGSSTREVISPLTERVFVMITQAVKAHVGMLCMGPREGTKFEIVHEMSKSLGQPMYVFNCTKTTDYIQLQDIFRGLASTGCWVCFNDLSMLQPSCLSLMAQMMATIMEALRAGKGAVHLQTDDVQLSPNGACFGLMSSSVPVKPHDSDRLLIYPSAAAQLPDSILNQFRVISLAKPDLLLSLQVMLFSQGFLYGRELAWKTNQLYETCQHMFGTNTFVTSNVMLGSSRSASFYGWSIQSLKGVVEEAGATLEKAQTEDKETGLSTIQEFGELSTDEGDAVTLVQAAKKLHQEEEALVTALRDTFLPRMPSRDASVFATIVNDLWPNIEVAMVFGGEEEEEGDRLVSGVKKYNSLHSLKSDIRVKSSKSQDSQRSIKDSLKLNTPVVPMLHAGHEKFSAMLETGSKQVLEDINDAIAVATADLALLPGTAFQARVMQLSQLNAAHQAILVVGPPGCGKSECIKTFAVAERERGKYINVQSIFTKAVETGELFGSYDPKTREWHDGLLTALLRKFCVTPPSAIDADHKNMMKIMQLDGECDSYQMELLQSILNNSGSVVMANNERLSIPDNLRVIWELETLEHMSPSVLATVGVLVMSSSDVGWKLMLVQWLEHRNEPDKDLLTEFCNIYLETIVNYVTSCTQPAMLSNNGKKKTFKDGMVGPPLIGVAPAEETPQYKRIISHSLVNMVRTFINLLEVLVNPFNDLSDVEYERYFNYAAIWAFGGTLACEHRENFSNWWKEQFQEHIDYPPEGTVFDYVVDNESHEFVNWKDLVPSYTGTPHQGIPQDAFVHTVQTEQLLHLLGLLTDTGKPVMLVGENGCGKTAIINERIRTVCSGEVAEVLSLTLYANRFTNARLLFDRIDERLEWKHGKTFVPKGNKRLLCLVDDVNLSQTDAFGHQTACELIREHLDDGGFYSPTNHMWRYVKSVTYVTSVNPQTTANVPALSQRLLRHFAVFGCPYPGNNDLKTIYSTLLNTHFFVPENTSSSSSAAQHFGLHDDRSHGANVRFLEESLRTVMTSMVKVTVELSDRMRSMFLPTAQRCHYFFTTRDLSTIFRNICLSLRPGCNKRNLLLLWQHEAFWVYGKRMVNEVDFRRFRQAFVTAVRKQFIDDDQIQTIIRPRSPLFSNLIEQDSGIVTAGTINTRTNNNVSDEDAKTDLYRPAKSFTAVKDLLEKGVEEYNKIHPRIKLALYKTVIEQVCRLARTIASPHEDANSVLVAEGCPVRCSVIVRLAANLCGYTIHQVTSTNPTLPAQARMEQFKADLVSGYTRAGAKGEHILLLLREEELAERDYLVYLTEFIISGAITHLFTYEEQTTIINSIRTEVTQAGLTYTRDVAWNFFLRTVRNNFRVMLVMCGGGNQFHAMCRDYPTLAKNVNFIWFPHWSKTQLIEHALFHVKEEMPWLTEMQQENVSHMLASMHLVLRQQDGGEQTCGEYCHINNTSYQKFVERFISLANAKNKEVNRTHETVTKTLQQIRHENEVAIRLKKQLEHEMVVLQERKAGTIKILSQIGQDTAITEQQIRVVKNQLEKITHLKKRLPEYQVAHERAVYKAIAIVADTKKVVKLMDVDDLAELRGMQKPSLEIEDLMAAIIMLLKSPSADLTWQKGAKRQMANLERFIEELTTFDDFQLPESTLVLVEPFLKKPSFEPEAMAEKTGNTACGALCKWVRGVVRYHRMMISKVKPLHQKVEETTLAVDSAQHKMNTLENKRKALEIRLADLARGFEEATIDKNEQEEKTVKMKKMLDTAAQLRRILRGERQRCQQIFDSFERRMVAIPGGCAMAAAFATYLGAYHHNFRRVMLTVHWPGCLRERGVPLVIDSVDGLRGRVIDWSIAFLKTASGASSVYEVDYATLIQNMGGSSMKGRQSATDEDGPVKDKSDDEEKERDEAERTGAEEDVEEDTGETTGDGETAGDVTKETGTREDETREEVDKTVEEEKADEEKDGSKTPNDPEKPRSEKSKTPPQPGAASDGGQKTPEGSAKPKTPTSQPGTPGKNKSNRNTPTNDNENDPDAAVVDQVSSGDGEEQGLTVPRLSKIQEEDGDMDDDLRSEMSTSTAPVLTASQYNKYVRSLIKLLVGEPRLNEWLMQDFGPRQIENVSILCTSWQRPPLMVDPNGEGTLWLGRLNSLVNKRKLISLDMDNRSDPHIMSSLEKAITKGKPVLMKNCGDRIDNMIAPLVHHRNTAHENDMEEEPRMILFCGRRTLCHPDFRFYLSSSEQKPQLNAITASSFTLINFGVSHDTLTEDLLTRVFARVRPELFKERSKALKNLQRQKDTLYRFSETVKDQVLSGGQEAMLSSPKALQFITNITDAKLQLAHQLADTQAILDDLDLLKDELYPIARRGSLLYSLMRSLAAIYPELRFTMDYFLHLFDEAVGGSLPEEFHGYGGNEEGAESEDTPDETDGRPRGGSVTSQTQQEEGGNDNGGEEEKPKEEEAKEDAGGEEEDEKKTNAGPAETEESVSTGAVNKLVHGSDSDELPTIEMPEVTPLPSEGVDYTSYTSAKVKVLMDSVTSLVYHRIKMCLFEEDRLLFSTLMCLNMKVEAGEDITNEEMSLFLQGNPGLGMQLSLQDFDCRDGETPTWLPTEKWEDILALSVLPGPLDSLCVDFACNGEAWKDWYQSPYPEKLALPYGGGEPIKKKEEDDEGEKMDEGTEKEEREGGRGNAGPQTPPLEGGRLNDFHRLLLLRMLRQDRLPTALLTYTQRHLALYDPEEEVFNVNEILKEARKHLGVLVLLPPAPSDPRGHPAMRLKLTRSPVEELILLAKAVGITVERAVVSDGSFVAVEEALDSADKHEGWAIIEGIHLTTPPLLAKLTGHLQRIHKSR